MLPKKVLLGNRTYFIKSRESDKLKGEIVYVENTIYLDPRLSHWELREVLYHEILHGMYNLYHITDECKEEPTVHRLAVGLAQLTKDNPKLMEFLNDRG